MAAHTSSYDASHRTPGDAAPASSTGALQREPLEQLPAIVERVIASYYAKNYQPLLDRATSDCIFIGAGNMVFNGRDDMLRQLPEVETAPSIFLRNARFGFVGRPSADATDATVYGTYRLFTGAREPVLLAAKQRITVCCSLIDGIWKAYHVHSSNEWNELVGEDVFPLQISMETYAYVRGILQAGQRAGNLPTRVALGTSKATRYVDPTQVLYIEADGKRSTLHLADGDTITLNVLLNDIQPQLPGTFFRVHRSFVVNAAQVSGIRKFTLELSDGTQIPIPERRYSIVRREMALRVTGGLDPQKS
ncbi:LytTR family transcriptional regulator [Collinsella tanakaei]|nr:LytTR family transcriptional regulator [Collinsella tanakaei]